MHRSIRFFISLFCCLFLPLSLWAQTLVATNSKGDKVSYAPGVQVEECEGVAIRFAYEPAPPAGTAYAWDFGNGNTSNDPTPFEQFRHEDDTKDGSQDGVFTVKLTLRFPDGTTKDIEATNFVKVPNVPKADFRANPAGGCVGATIPFYALDNNGNPIAPGTYSKLYYLIDNQLYDGNEALPGAPASVTFPKEGLYDVTMYAVTPLGCTYVVEKKAYIRIQQPFEASFTPGLQLSCATSLPVSFRAQATDKAGNPIALSNPVYEWDFGDGQSGSGQQLNHTFTRTTAGTKDFTVTLRICSEGCEAITQRLAVKLIDLQGFTAQLPTSYCNGYPVTFSPTALDAALNGLALDWDFGDGQTGSSMAPNGIAHTFQNPTSSPVTRTVRMRVQGADNCEATLQVVVPPIPAANVRAEADITEFCTAPFTVRVRAENLQNVNSVYWRVRNTAATIAPTHPQGLTANITIPAYGTYVIELWHNSGNPATDCILNTLTVNAQPLQAILSARPDEGCDPLNSRLSVQLLRQNASGQLVANTIPIARYDWTVTDVTPVTPPRTPAVRAFTTTVPTLDLNALGWGTYEARVQVTSEPQGQNAACTADAGPVRIRVGRTPDIDFTHVPVSPICNETTVDFFASWVRNSLPANYPLSHPDYALQFEWDYTGNGTYVPAIDLNGDGRAEEGRFTYDNFPPYANVPVRLRVRSNGCVSAYVEKIIRIEPPLADFVVQTDPCRPTWLQIDNRSLPDAPSGGFTWTIQVNGGAAVVIKTDDINLDLTQHPSFPTFAGLPKGELPAGAQVYIHLEVSHGICTDQHELRFRMPDALPLPNVSPKTATLCVGEQQRFETPVAGAARYTWTFTGPETLTFQGQRIDVSFSKIGTYQGHLLIELANGCRVEEDFGPIDVHGITVALSGPAAGCAGDTFIYKVQVIETSDPNLTWEWYVDGKLHTQGSAKNGRVDDLKGLIFPAPLAPQSGKHRIELRVQAHGCRTSVSTEILVTRPVFDFSGDIAQYVTLEHFCDQVLTHIDPRLDDNKVYDRSHATYQWIHVNAGNAVIGNMPALSYRLPEGQQHTLLLRITDTNGCSGEATLQVNVPMPQPPTADFTAYVRQNDGTLVASDKLQCPGPMTFIDRFDGTAGNSTLRVLTDVSGVQTKHPILRWHWNFGDGSPVVVTNSGQVSHIYKEGGEYEVLLTIEELLPNGEVCFTHSQKRKVIVGGTRGYYLLHRRAVYDGQKVTMEGFPVANNLASIANTQYSWSSGDGDASALKKPTFTYNILDGSAQKTAMPVLFFVDENGCRYAAANSGDIIVYNLPKLANLPDQITCVDFLTNSAYKLDIEDKGFSPINLKGQSERLLVNAERNISVQYDYDFTSEVHYQWYVDGAPIPASDSPVQNFLPTTSLTPGYYEVNPDVYPNGRTYQVKVWVESHYKGTARVIGDVNNPGMVVPVDLVERVARPELEKTFRMRFDPTPRPSFVSSTPCAGEATQLDATATDFPAPAGAGLFDESKLTVIYEWDFNTDNNTAAFKVDATGMKPAFAFPAPGRHPVALRVRTDKGCVQQVCQDVMVHPLPAPTFTFKNVCETFKVTFTDASTIQTFPYHKPTLVKWEWDFNSNGGAPDLVHTSATDAANFEIDFATHLDGKTGAPLGTDKAHTVTLKVSSNNGCVATYTSTAKVYLFQTPEANFSAAPLNSQGEVEQCEGTAVSFKDEASVKPTPGMNPDENKIVYWAWDFGDGSPLLAYTDQNKPATIAHVYDNPTPDQLVYTAKLTVRTFFGCENTKELDIRVNPNPELTLQPLFEVCSDETAKLEPSSPKPAHYAFAWTQLNKQGGEVAEGAKDQALLSLNATSFNPGSHLIEADYRLQVRDIRYDEQCPQYDTTKVQIYRKPEINGFADKDSVNLWNCENTYTIQSILRNGVAEVIGGFSYQWSRRGAVQGGSLKVSNAKNQSLTLNNPVFADGSHRIAVTYRLMVTNKLSGCSDQKEIKVVFYRTPSVAANVTEFCQPEGAGQVYNPLTDNSVPGFAYAWIQKSATGGSLLPASSAQQSLQMSGIDYAANSILLTAVYNLKMVNKDALNCTSDNDITFTFRREPKPELSVSQQSCGQTATVFSMPGGAAAEQLAYNYGWIIAPVGGNVDILSGTQAKQDLKLQVKDYAIDAHRIDLNAALSVVHPAQSGCKASATKDLTFFRTPKAAIDQSELVLCQYEQATLQPTEEQVGEGEVPGFVYRWELTSLKDDEGKDVSLSNLSPQQAADSWSIQVKDPVFPAGASKLVATYTLTISNADSPGCSSQVTRTLTYYNDPEVSLALTDVAAKRSAQTNAGKDVYLEQETETLGIALQALSRHPAYPKVDVSELYWNFGNGEDRISVPGPMVGGQHQQQQTSKYQNPGWYTASVIAYDDRKAANAKYCQAPAQQEFYVAPTPVITLLSDQVCQGGPSAMVANVAYAIDQADNQSGSLYTWDFGDGSASIQTQHPLNSASHTYKKPGVYTLTVKVVSKYGATAVQTRQVRVLPVPLAAFTAPAEQCMQGNAFTFQDAATVDVVGIPTSKIVQWAWDFGDGTQQTYATATNPTHSYATPGTYQVSLQVTANEGCVSAPFTKQVVVHPMPEFTLANQEACGTSEQIVFLPQLGGVPLPADARVVWTEPYEVVGGNLSKPTYSGLGMSFRASMFDKNSAKITGKVKVRLQDARSPLLCETELEAEFVIYRYLTFQQATLEQPPCVLEAKLYPLGLDESLEHGHDMVFNWRVAAIRGSSISDSDLQQRHNSQLHKQNFTLQMLMSDFASGSNRIEVDMELTVNPRGNGGCVGVYTQTVVFVRAPQLTPELTQEDCAYDVTIHPMGKAETVPGFTYTWTATGVQGSSKPAAYFTQQLQASSTPAQPVLTVTDADFARNSDKIIVTVAIKAANGDCQDESSIEITIKRRPVFDFAEENQAPCVAGPTTLTIRPFGQEVIGGGFQYAWSVKDVQGYAGAFPALTPAEASGSTLPVTVAPANFQAGVSKISITYTLRVQTGNQPACQAQQDYTVHFFRTPVAGIAEQAADICAPAKTVEATEQLPDYAYRWSVKEVRGGTASISDATQSSLSVSLGSFAGNSAMVAVDLQLQVTNTLSGFCQDTATYTLRFFRTPVLNPLLTQEDCGLEASLRAMEPVLDSTRFAWTQQLLTGGALKPEQGMDQNILKLAVAGFDAAAHRLDATYRVRAYNGSGAGTDLCDAQGDQSVTFFRTPLASLVTNQPAPVCQEQSVTLQVKEAHVPGFVYTWTPAVTADNGAAGASVSVEQRDNQYRLHTPVFPLGAATLQVQVPVKVENGDSPSCFDTAQGQAVFHRTPSVDLGADPAAVCHDQSLTLSPAEEQVDGFLYQWTVVGDALTDLGDKVKVRLQGESLRTLKVWVEAGDFPMGSSQIKAVLRLRVHHKDNAVCVSEDEIAVTFQRQSLAEVADKPAVCETSQVLLHPENEEKVQGFAYSWTQQSIAGGALTETLSEQGYKLTLGAASFGTGQHRIDATYQLQVLNQSLNACLRTDQVRVSFLRQPEVVLSADKGDVCATETVTLAPAEENVSGFVYAWRLKSIRTDQDASGAGASLQTSALDAHGLQVHSPVFPAGASQIEAVYELRVRNSEDAGCEAVSEIKVNFLRAPVFTLPQGLSDCQDGKLSLQPEGDEPVANFRYRWVQTAIRTDVDASGAGASVQTTAPDAYRLEVFAPVFPAGAASLTATYALQVENALGATCTLQQQAEVTFFRTPEAQLGDDQQACQQEVLQLAPTDEAVGNFSYRWTLLQTEGGKLTGISDTGKHQLSVWEPVFEPGVFELNATFQLQVENKLSGSCQDTDQVQVTFYRAPVGRFEVIGLPGCDQKEVLFRTAASELPLGDNTFEWDLDGDGTFERKTKGDFRYTYTAVGRYLVSMRVVSDKGCISPVVEQEILIHPTPQPAFQAIPVCFGAATQFENQTQIAAGPLQRAASQLAYGWVFDYKGGALDETTAFDSRDFAPAYTYAKPGTYTVALYTRSPEGCASTLVQQVVVHALPEPTIQAPRSICYGQEAELTATGGVAYAWAHGETTASIRVRPLQDMTYTVTVTDANGCQQTVSHLLRVIPGPQAADEAQTCAYAPIQLDGSVGDYQGIVDEQYLWTTPDANNGKTTRKITPQRSGLYKVRTIVLHDTGISCEYEQEIDVVIHPAPADVMQDTIFCFDDNAQIRLQAAQHPSYVYAWENGETTSSVLRAEPGRYMVRITDTSSAEHCTIVDQVDVKEICPPKVQLPNAFTPNGDGLNDQYVPVIFHCFDIEMTIYNRWGEVIFKRKYANDEELRAPGNGWDGTYRRENQPMAVYTCVVTYYADEQPTRKQQLITPVTLIR